MHREREKEREREREGERERERTMILRDVEAQSIAENKGLTNEGLAGRG